jgi:glycosyltransferase involved in cell wall biosynthesis
LRYLIRGAIPDIDETARRLVLDDIRSRRQREGPEPFGALPSGPAGGPRLHGTGVYLRNDFWARAQSGGSYGHTCYVAKELAAICDQFLCLVSQRFALLDELAVQQIVLDPPGTLLSENEMLAATRHYVRVLRPLFELLRPSFTYERLCLGNYAGSMLSQEFRVPHVIEYNGSEISMLKSFSGSRYIYEDVYLAAEDLAFDQATIISVVSEPIKEKLVERGVDEAKILVNPNGVDVTAYAPPDAAERASIRAELDFAPSDVIVGFTGTFGGWHGIDVLAEAIPRIAVRAANVKFLLIGDGGLRHLIDRAVQQHGLEARVTRTGRVPQTSGARLLRACDLFVSPHSAHMVDSRFFGSPTKIFEYMAMGGAIVASDLEQIGEVLSPALRLADLKASSTRVSNQRAVLCTPGDIDEFVEAVCLLSERRDLCPPLGANARRAAATDYSWTRHVGRLVEFIAGRAAVGGDHQAVPRAMSAAGLHAHR